MGRGKIEIKKIENKTSRQVTFSKRRNGIMKKAHELTVLCDATVSLLMISGSTTEKIYEYITPGTTFKKMYDEYQKISNVDIWSAHYEKMQHQERQLLETNNMLRREISKRMGGNLEDVGIHDLCSLEQEMSKAVEIIRDQKFHKIKTRTGTTRKKVNSLRDSQRKLVSSLEAIFEGPKFGIVDQEDERCGYEAVGGYGNEGAAAAAAANLYGLTQHPPRHPNLHNGGDYANNYELRLA